MSAFYGCDALNTVTIPSSVVSIGNKAFLGCNNLKTIQLNSVNCGDFSVSYYPLPKTVEQLIIGNLVEHIPAYIAYQMSELTSVVIGKSVNSIGNNAFAGCNGLTQVHIEDIAAWCKINFPTLVANPLYYAHHLFVNGTELSMLNIPNSITTIGYGAFAGCHGLSTVTIPSSVNSIKNCVFMDCNGLSSVVIPNSVLSIGDSAFLQCSELASVIIPNSINMIGLSTFSGCSGMTSVVIPNSVTTISDKAFANCGSLTSIDIPNSVINIGNNAFAGCNGLTSITVPYSIASIGNNAFGCTGLTNVVWNAKTHFNFTNTNNPFMSAKSSIQTFVFGDSVSQIPSYLCKDMTELTEVNIPHSIYTIGGRAFYGCVSLPTISIPNSVTTIGESAFCNCKSLSSVTIPSSITSLSASVFNGCSSWTAITIPSSVVSIREGAFLGCTGLTQVIIGENVTSYGNNAFANCKFLEDLIVLRERPVAIPEDTFSGIPMASCDLHVPQGSKERYEYQDVWKDFLYIIDDAENYAEGGTTPPSGSGVHGDVTGDGTVDISDVNAVINIMLGKQ